MEAFSPWYSIIFFCIPPNEKRERRINSSSCNLDKKHKQTFVMSNWKEYMDKNMKCVKHSTSTNTNLTKEITDSIIYNKIYIIIQQKLMRWNEKMDSLLITSFKALGTRKLLSIISLLLFSSLLSRSSLSLLYDWIVVPIDLKYRFKTKNL